MCQLCQIARIAQKRKYRSQEIQNTSQLSSVILHHSTQKNS
jgi:hypothetical protein